MGAPLAAPCLVQGSLCPWGPVSGNGRHSQELWRGQPYLEAVLEFPTDEVESHGVDAGVEGGHVDPEVIHHQEETEAGGERRAWACWMVTERRTEGGFPNCLAWEPTSTGGQGLTAQR